MLVFTAVISLATGVLFGLGPLVGNGPHECGRVAENRKHRVAKRSHSRSAERAWPWRNCPSRLFRIVRPASEEFSGANPTTLALELFADPTARLSLPRSRYPDNRTIAAFERELLAALSRKPGVVVEGRPPLPVGL